MLCKQSARRSAEASRLAHVEWLREAGGGVGVGVDERLRTGSFRCGQRGGVRSRNILHWEALFCTPPLVATHPHGKPALSLPPEHVHADNSRPSTVTSSTTECYNRCIVVALHASADPTTTGRTAKIAVVKHLALSGMIKQPREPSPLMSVLHASACVCRHYCVAAAYTRNQDWRL